MKFNMIVTRHPALLEYLNELGMLTTDVVVLEHATAEELVGKDVVGVLPHHLSCKCSSFSEVPLDLPQDLRGKELTLEQVYQYAGKIATYTVRSKK